MKWKMFKMVEKHCITHQSLLRSQTKDITLVKEEEEESKEENC